MRKYRKLFQRLLADEWHGPHEALPRAPIGYFPDADFLGLWRLKAMVTTILRRKAVLHHGGSACEKTRYGHS
jgi:hypothetical protein